MVWWDRDVEPGSVRNCYLPMAPTATMAEQEGARQKWVIAWHGDSHVICSQQNSYLLNFLYSLIPLALCSCERDCEKKKKIPVWDFTYPRKSCCHGLGMALPSLVPSAQDSPKPDAATSLPPSLPPPPSCSGNVVENCRHKKVG